jgi:hypothetical protein
MEEHYSKDANINAHPRSEAKMGAIQIFLLDCRLSGGFHENRRNLPRLEKCDGGSDVVMPEPAADGLDYQPGWG